VRHETSSLLLQAVFVVGRYFVTRLPAAADIEQQQLKNIMQNTGSQFIQPAH